MPDTVETVTTPATPPAAPTSFREHYEAAKSAAEPESKAEETAAPATSDDTTTETKEPPAEDTKADDQPKETATSEDQLLPADEIAKLSTKERTAYEKAQKNYTLKTQALAAERKELEQWKPLIDGLSQNPDATMEELAKARGYKLVKADTQDTAAQVTATGLEQALAEVPEDVRPLFEAFGKKLIDSVRGDFKKEIEPIKETHRQNEIESIQKQTDSVIKAFDVKYPDWKKHEPRMLEIAKDFQPSGKTDEFKYMESLLTLATANISEAEKTKKVVDKINKSAAKAEEPVQPTSEKLVTHALPSPERRGLREAYEAAKRGEVWQK